MALSGDYTELLLDKEKWLDTYKREEFQMLAALGWLIINILVQDKKRPSVVVKFEELS